VGRGISAGTMGIVVLAILAGLVGAYIIRASLIREPVVEPTALTITIPIATADLPRGRTIAFGDVGITTMSQDAAQAAYGSDLVRIMTDASQIIGRVVKDPRERGKPFYTDSLFLQGSRYDYTQDLAPGYRAVSLQVPRDRGGSLPIGSLVDIMFRSTERRPATGLAIPEVTVRLLEGLKIIDVYEPPPPTTARSRGVLDIRESNLPRVQPPPTVTLAMTPEQAEVVQAVSGRGEMTLVARPLDERVAAAGRRKGLTLQDVLGIEPPPPVVLFATELYRRGARSVNVFRDDKLVEQIRSQQEQQPVTPMPPAPGDVAPAPLPPQP
jgi:Flp pilus assembly protein CpaB